VQYLSKSDYLKYRVHPAYLWYQKHQPQKLPKYDDNRKYMFEQGDEFESLAMQVIGEVTVIDGDPLNIQHLTEATIEAIDGGSKRLAQPAFVNDELLYCRPDLLEKIDDNQWRLTEIKSSTSFKRQHRYDLGFQRHVLTSLGFNIAKVQLIHVNRDYVRSGDIDPERLVASRDVTEDVMAIEDEVAKEIEKAQSVIKQAEVNDHPAMAGNLNRWLEVYRHLYPDLPEDSVLNLIQLKPQLVRETYHQGIESMTKLDTDQLTSKQTAQVNAWKMDEININPQNVAEFLNEFEYPLYFLDYETSAYVVPMYDGIKPYQQLPFQYSLHKLQSPGGELEHFEYLHTDDSLPVQPLVNKMLSEIGTNGTVLAWFHKFEMYCNRIMAQLDPNRHDQLYALNQRMVDLRVPFARGDYVDKRFQGSSSLKNVLPVMCPELSYKELGIQEGGAAQRLWQQVQSGQRDDQAQQIYADLLEYCKLDTFAMVEIYRKLRRAAELEDDLVQTGLF